MIVAFRLLGGCLISACFLSLASRAQDSELTVPFRAPGLVHCQYRAAGGAPFLVSFRLVRVFNGKAVVLDQGATLSGQRRLDNLEVGLHEFRIEGLYSDTTFTPPRQSTNTIAQTWATLTSTNIIGNLLFNESLGGAPELMDASVTVPNGVSFSLDSAQLSSCTLAGDGRFALTGCQVRSFNPSEAGSLSVARSRFDRLFAIRPTLQASFVDCLFRDPQATLPFVVSGTPQSPDVTFEKCELDGIYGLRLAGGRSVTLRENVFTGPVSFEDLGWNEAAGKVIIEQNSFLGSTALSYNSSSRLNQPLPVGRNYYGDFHGPNNWAFASGRGAVVQADAFSLPAKDKVTFKGKDLQNRRFPANTEDPPIVYTLGVRVGQNSFSTVGPIIRQGRETLVSVDLACNWKQVSGVQVYAELDGARIDPIQQVDLFRDWFDSAASGNASASKVAAGETTFNVILPAQTKASADLKVFIDTTHSGAFGTNGYVRSLFSQTLALVPAPGRPLRILVVPVQVKLAGYPTNTPTAAPVATALRKMLPAFLPLKQEELKIDTDTAHVYSAEDAGFFDSWTVYSLSYTLTEWLQTYLEEYNALGAGVPYDRIVGVVPAGTFAGGAEGVNVATSREAMLVEENKPTAAIHELGHSFGLYTWKEEYNIVEGGYSVDQVTGFLPESSINLAGVPGMAGITRIRHFNNSFQDNYTDIMGSLDPQWIIPGTLRDFGTSVLSFLASKPRVAAFKPMASPRVAAGKRKVLISGAYARLGSPWPWDTKRPSYAFVRGTLSALDVTDRPDLILPSSNGGQADPMTFQTLDNGLMNIWADSQYINIPGPSDERSPIGFWNQTFEYTPIASYLSIASSKDDRGHMAGDPFLFLHPDPNLAVQVKSPQNGAKLNDTFLLEMQSSGPVSHWLFYSLDGNTWTRFGPRLRSNQTRLTTGFLPSGTTVALRVRSSDSFFTVTNDVTGLTLSSSPQVVITEPAGATVFSPVTLSAMAGADAGRTPTVSPGSHPKMATWEPARTCLR